jgi:hypothetical protein
MFATKTAKPEIAVRRLKEEQLHLFDRVATKSHRRHAGRHQMQLFSVSVCGLLLVLRLFCLCVSQHKSSTKYIFFSHF